MVDLGAQMEKSGTLGGLRRRNRPLIVDPTPRAVRWPLFSVDDHLLEPPDVFTSRMPSSYGDRVPRMVEDAGMEWWEFEDERVENSGVNAMISWASEDRTFGPVRFDEVRPGTYDVHERIRDMDIGGVAVSLCFPSMVFGFCGQRFSKFKDPNLGLAAMRAYNDWVIEEWAGAYPARLVPQQVPWLLDPKIAAEEVRRNAGRGFKAVAFSENPEALGLPSLYSRDWDPFFAACEETETVINLHVGSSSQTLVPSQDSPPPVIVTLFPINALMTTVDWLYSGIATRFSKLKIVLSESGIGWVGLLHDRLEFISSRFCRENDGGMYTTWADEELTPMEVLRRNFWFTTFFDPSAYRQIDLIGADRVMMEVDYPHSDSTWPDTQDAVSLQLEGLPEETQLAITHANAAEVYRHPFPAKE